MNLYAVFLPADDSSGGGLERAAFVKQGFHWEAFLLTPIWAARRQLWRALVFWIIWVAVLAGIAVALQLNREIVALLYLVGASAFGLEGDQLEQSHLAEAGFALRSFAFGASSREAEEIFFDGPAKDFAPPPPVSGEHQASAAAGPAAAIDLLGLFPSGDPKN
jgi:Protein of unknown function (DUF2628)